MALTLLQKKRLNHNLDQPLSKMGRFLDVLWDDGVTNGAKGPDRSTLDLHPDNHEPTQGPTLDMRD